MYKIKQRFNVDKCENVYLLKLKTKNINQLSSAMSLSIIINK